MVDLTLKVTHQTFSLRPKPTPEQRRAADPAHSVWVRASAGTGKTRILADRVLRLLLAGCDARQILCLTFTKAAAAEMVTRIQKDLVRFATLPEDLLLEELARLLGRSPLASEIARARTLLAQVLDLPAGLSIMTIHSFCQLLLRRFPLEAQVVPHFQVIEPRDASDLMREAQDQVLTAPSAEIQAALERLAVLLGEVGLREGLLALRGSRLRLATLLRRHGSIGAVIEQIAALLGINPNDTLESVRREFCHGSDLDSPALKQACEALKAGADGDRTRAAAITAWLAADLEARLQSFADYECVFLTKEGEVRKALIGKACMARFPGAKEALLAEQARIAHLAARCKALAAFERTRALLIVGAAVIEAYERRKLRKAALDFDDLIERAFNLLTRPALAPWVQYKLDQQIDHLLVDEGQDTSPEQWAIIQALCDDFFSGQGARDVARTLFVVGDEKQSIFSFQGADLETYQSVHAHIAARARFGRVRWREEPLARSFRSARAILEVVDKVFESASARDGVIGDGVFVRHETARGDAPGMVEIWPLLEVEAEERDASGWRLPDEIEAADEAEPRLARLISERILHWLNAGVRLPSTGQPIRPGDIMILLPRRGALQDLLIRHLKRHNIPVAGADRLTLTDEIAVMDLIALGDAVLLPEDDLTFAALLKSPLFGLSEDDLFALAHDRGGMPLFRRLEQMREQRPVLNEAWERFAELRTQADFAPPFEFYARLLGEGGGRRRFLARLGHAALEPIEAFLAQALAYERGHAPSLQGFLQWLRSGATELVRDPERPRDEVRVLTVHGAKGLEAPVVILPDTTFVPPLQDKLLWIEPHGLPLWKMSTKRQDSICMRACERARVRQLQEQKRLLYVALTRAQDWLIVTGWGRKCRSDVTWYDMITAGIASLPSAERITFELAPGCKGEGWRYTNRALAHNPQTPLPLPRRRQPPPELPLWAREPAPADDVAASPLGPSRLVDEEPSVSSPLTPGTQAPFLRGRLIHRLLQSLPDLPEGEREAAMAKLLGHPGLALAADAQAEIAAAVRAILATPGLAPLFAPGSRAEVPLLGRIGDQRFSGQVDRLAVSDDEVLVIDYKTARDPPACADAIPLVYWRQMAAYRALLRTIYPGRKVRCALLWTEGPTLMLLDDAALERHTPSSPVVLKGGKCRTNSP